MNQTLQIPIGEMMLEAQMAAQAAEPQLAGDVRAIAAYNARDPRRRISGSSRSSPARSGPTSATIVPPGTKWLVDLFGYAYSCAAIPSEETTVVEQVPPSYVPQTDPDRHAEFHRLRRDVPLLLRRRDARSGPSTVSGRSSPSASGDLVLTQDAKIRRAEVPGRWSPSTTTRPTATYRVALDGGDPIVATGIHRLWKAGKGWTMARELKPGDVLRTLGGLASVKAVEADRTQLVYNLQVADGESYFVGKSGVLAHDNSTINPVPEPFDAVAPLAEAAASSRPRPGPCSATEPGPSPEEPNPCSRSS